jgi:hypothetical protein
MQKKIMKVVTQVTQIRMFYQKQKMGSLKEKRAGWVTWVTMSV